MGRNINVCIGPLRPPAHCLLAGVAAVAATVDAGVCAGPGAARRRSRSADQADARRSARGKRRDRRHRPPPRRSSCRTCRSRVTAYSGEQLEREGAIDITDIGDTTPNVTLEVSRGTNSTLTAFIRGIGQQDPVAGFEQGVGIYLDDVYLNRPQGAVLDIYDVERIEVLRGPQGTLYGRNTIGGAVKYVTRRLSDEPELSLRGTVGTYGQLDAVATRFLPDRRHVPHRRRSVARLTRDGFGKNFTTGEDNYNKDVLAGRVSAEIGRDDSALLRLSGDYTKDKSDARGGHRLIPGLFTGAPVLDDEFDTRGGLDDPKQEVTNKGVAAHGQVEVADGFTLKSITAFRKDKSTTPIDFDALAGGRCRRARHLQEQAVQPGSPAGGRARPAVRHGRRLLPRCRRADDLRRAAVHDLQPDLGFTGASPTAMSTPRPGRSSAISPTTSPTSSASRSAAATPATSATRRCSANPISAAARRYSAALGIPFRRTDLQFRRQADRHRFHAARLGQLQAERRSSFLRQLFAGLQRRRLRSARPDDCRRPISTATGVDADEIYEYMTFEPEQVTSYELGWKGSFFDKRVLRRRRPVPRQL